MKSLFNRTTVEQVRAGDWRRWITDHQGVVLDVREPGEWAMGTLPGATKMSMSQIEAEWESLDPEAPTLVVCRSGNRSNAVARALHDAGFAHVANLAGGMAALGLA